MEGSLSTDAMRHAHQALYLLHEGDQVDLSNARIETDDVRGFVRLIFPVSHVLTGCELEALIRSVGRVVSIGNDLVSHEMKICFHVVGGDDQGGEDA